jgi:hypothetical protein
MMRGSELQDALAKFGNVVIIVSVNMLRRQKNSMDFDKIWFRGLEF